MSRVHLPRYCHAGLNGPDVTAYSEIYRRIHLRDRPKTRHFGLFMVAETRRFQREHGIRSDGVVGPKTFEALRPHFNSYDRWLFQKETKLIIPSASILVVGAMTAMYKHRPFRYIETRPYPDELRLFWEHGSDCSGTSTGGYHYAYLFHKDTPDPNGLHFDGYGYTGTMLNHGTRVGSPAPGDLCFYYPTYSHVGVYLGGGRVFSHGHTGDPRIIPSSWATQTRRYL